VKRLGDIELQRAQLLKALRTNIRLKHSLAADEEINEKLPAFEAAFDKAVQSGKTYELDIRSVLGED
jgi:hypothetical protein